MRLGSEDRDPGGRLVAAQGLIRLAITRAFIPIDLLMQCYSTPEHLTGGLIMARSSGYDQKTLWTAPSSKPKIVSPSLSVLLRMGKRWSLPVTANPLPN